MAKRHGPWLALIFRTGNPDNPVGKIKKSALSVLSYEALWWSLSR
jgi:hypothetical protein